MFENFTERAIKVMVGAQLEASKTRTNFNDDTHLLAGICIEASQNDENVLAKFGLTNKILRMEVAAYRNKEADQTTVLEIPFTDRVKNIMRRAAERAESNNRKVLPEDLLFELLQEKDCRSVEILKRLGVEIVELQKAVVDVSV